MQNSDYPYSFGSKRLYKIHYALRIPVLLENTERIMPVIMEPGMVYSEENDRFLA